MMPSPVQCSPAVLANDDFGYLEIMFCSPYPHIWHNGGYLVPEICFDMLTVTWKFSALFVTLFQCSSSYLRLVGQSVFNIIFNYYNFLK